MAPLNAAFAFAQVNHFAMLVAQNLKLNVPRMLQESLRVNVGRAKCLLRFAARRFVRRQQLFRLPHNAHATAAATCDCLQYQRVTNVRGFFRELHFTLDRAIAAGNRRQARGFHFTPRAVLLAHHFDDFRARTDKRDFTRLAHLCKVGVFGKEAVSRMDRVHVRDFRRANDLRNIQITLAAARGADADSFVRKPHVQGIPIGFGIDGDSADA